MKNNSHLAEDLTDQIKETWIKPEITLLEINQETLGRQTFSGHDGGGFPASGS